METYVFFLFWSQFKIPVKFKYLQIKSSEMHKCFFTDDIVCRLYHSNSHIQTLPLLANALRKQGPSVTKP